MNKESPFDAIPSGVGIAHYFVEECHLDIDNQGADGIPLWREVNAYSYAWVEAKVDHDLEQYWLLDIRTAKGEEPFDETRDFLFVATGVGIKGVECEWHNQPVRFDASNDLHLERLNSGLKWFVQCVIGATEEIVDANSH